MRQFLAITEPFIKQARTRTSGTVAAGSAVAIPVQNTTGFAINSYIAIGQEGSELAELAQVSSVGTNTLTVTTLKFNYPVDTPIVNYRYNQRRFYGALSEDGVYNHLTAYGSPVAIQVDDPQGTRFEYSGSEGYTFFKATYYNSTTDEETSLGDSESAEADETTRYATLYDIRKHAGLVGNPYYSDLRLETKRKQAENEINSAIHSRYSLPLTEVPALLSQICELLAAGYIDFEEFGAEGEGKKWLGEARALLKQLQTGERLLIGVDGNELTRRAMSDRMSGHPNSTDTDDFAFPTNLRF
jgi:phage gp36-like protein